MLLAIMWTQTLFLSSCGGNTENASVSLEDDLATFKLHASGNYLRALELSLYYQGFDPDKIFYSLDGYMDGGPRAYDEVPHNLELIGQKEMRDAIKSFKWAQKAYKLRQRHPLVVANLAKHYIDGIGVEKDSTKAKELIENAPQNYPGSGFSIYKSYFAYRGISEDVNLNKTKELLKSPDILSWKNFYIGKFAPYDRDFAIFVLKNTADENLLSAADFLKGMYDGNFNPADKNALEAKLWDEKLNDALAAHIVRAKEKRLELVAEYRKRIGESPSPQKEKLMRLLSSFMLQKSIYTAVLFNRKIFVENPAFNPAEAEDLLRQTGLSGYDLYSKLCLNSYIQNGEDQLSLSYYDKATKLAGNNEKNQLAEIPKKGLHARIRNLSVPIWADNFEGDSKILMKPLTHIN